MIKDTDFNTTIRQLQRRESANALEALRRQGALVVRFNGQQPIGICLSPTNALSVFGRSMWNTGLRGLPLKKLDTVTHPLSKDWYTITFNHHTAFVYASLSYVQENWDQLQVNLHSDLVMKIAQELDMAAWPHIELEAKKLELLKANWRHDIPYCQVDDLVNQGNAEILAEEIEYFGKPVILSRDHVHVKAYMGPLSMIPRLEERDLPFETFPVSKLKQKNYNLDPGTAYIVSRISPDPHKQPTPQFLLFHPHPSAPIKGLIDNLHCYEPLEDDFETDVIAECKSLCVPSQSDIQTGIEIARTFQKAVRTNGCAARILYPKTGGERFIGAIGNLQIAELLKSVPLSTPLKMGRALPSIQERLLLFRMLRGDENGLMSCPDKELWSKHDVYKLGKNLSNLFAQMASRKDSKNILPVFSKEGTEIGLLTTSPQVYLAAQRLGSLITSVPV